MTRRVATITDLSDAREAAFVAALFELGGPQYAAVAVMRAGYTNDETEARRIAAHLLSSPRISSVIAGEAKTRFEPAAVAAFRTLVDICAHGKSEAARISAAQEILNRAIGPIPSRSFSVTARATIEDLLTQLDKAGAPSGTDSSPVIDHDPA